MRTLTLRKRVAVGIATALAATTALAGCSGSSDPGGDEPIEQIELTLGHAYSPESLENRGAESFAERVSELTDGTVTVSVYPSSQLGSWEEMQESLELGSVDIVFESLGSLERYTPLASIEGLPFLYSDFDHFVSVWDSELKDEILGAVREATGFELIGAFPRGGGRELNSSRPIHDLDDLQGLKMRVPGQDAYIQTWQTLGAAPTPLALNEVFGALEQGAIDALEGTRANYRAASYYEVAPYTTKTNHLFGNTHFQFWGESFDALSDDTKQALRQAADDVSVEFRSIGLDEDEENRVFLEEAGVEFIEVDIAPWREKVAGLVEAADPVVRDWAERIIAMD